MDRFRVVLLMLTLVAPPMWAQENVPEVARQKLAEADRYRESGRTDEAIARYREVIEIAPSLLSAYVGLGAVYHQSKDYERAIEIFVAGLERYPDDPSLLFNAAATELRLARLDEALAYADRCSDVSGDDPAVHSLKGAIWRQLGGLQEALDSYRRAAELDSNSARAQYNLGNTYYQLDRKNEALDAYRKAIQIDKHFHPAHYNLGAVLFELEHFDDALAAYEVALAPVEADFEKGRDVAPAHARAYLNLGAIYLRRKSWDRALDAYEKAARLDGSDAAAHYNVGYIHYQLGQNAEAYEAYRRALSLDAELPLSYLHLGLIDFESGRMEEAARWLEAGLSRLQGPDRDTAVLTLAEAYQRLGKVVEAVETYRRVLQSDADNVTALVNLGRLLRLRGELDEARAVLERAGNAVLDSSGVAIELAALARASGDVGRERALYQEALRRDGHRTDMWPVRINLVALLFRSGATDEAMAELEVLRSQVTAVAASSPELVPYLRTTYALLKARAGDAKTARSELEAVLSDNGDVLAAANGLAALNASGGDVDDALRRWSALVARTGGEKLDALVRANLGQALWLSGRPDEARRYLLEAAEAFPANASLRTALGEIALARRDYPAAVRELKAALDGCGSAMSSPATRTDVVEMMLGGSDAHHCERTRRVLGVSLVASAGTQMVSARREAMRALEEAVRYPLDPEVHAQALFMRGTLLLQGRENARARSDLEEALSGALPESLVAAAHNNLGVALYRAGATAKATEHFERARARMSRLAPATLNLAIASHDGKRPEEALALYEQYLSMGGGRSADARAWADSIRRVYR